MNQRIAVGISDQMNGAAFSTVAAIGPAARHEFLAAKTQGAAAAMAGSNVDVDFVYKHVEGAEGYEGAEGCDAAEALFDRMNADEPAAGAVIFELHTSRDLGKECVVLTETDIQSRPKATSTLTHQDRSAGHDVAIVPLHAQSL